MSIETTEHQNKLPNNWRLHMISVAFLLSGAAGLMYQIAWQRLLFVTFGVDLISVSIIVSTFMLGLGLGALAGGWISDLLPKYTLAFFVVCEIAVGTFGVFSPDLIRSLGEVLLNASFPIIAIANFALMLIPTFFMGATLPLLIKSMSGWWSNVGAVTGHLYAFNTLGALLGTAAMAFWLFNYFELDQTIRLAAGINFLVAILATLVVKNKS